MEEERVPKDLLDVITFYPPRAQAAIYLTLDYVDQGLSLEGRVLCFSEIEKLSDGIIMDLMGGMMKSMDMDSNKR